MISGHSQHEKKIRNFEVGMKNNKIFFQRVKIQFSYWLLILFLYLFSLDHTEEKQIELELKLFKPATISGKFILE
jgi:hypothetical protein